MPSDLIAAIQEVNRNITGLVSKLSQNSFQANSSGLPPGELKSLDQKIAQVPKLLGQFSPAQTDREVLRDELHQYVENLEALRTVLRKVGEVLGKRRDRIKKKFNHLSSARAWMETYRATHRT